jgi:8-oxo-dGTP pyrophosphatase MutT (NUDIX family)
MHRRPLLDLLDRFSTEYPTQSQVAAEFRCFVEMQPDCFERTCAPGHVTGSAWLLHPEHPEVLLTHHRKLNRWLQPGGHADGCPDVLAVAMREAQEESGITAIEQLTPTMPLDLDIHEIPARPGEPAHLHYDVRFLLRATADSYVVSEESHDLAWVPLERIAEFNPSDSLRRMAERSRAYLAGV